VKVGGELSEEGYVSSGVPQDTVVGQGLDSACFWYSLTLMTVIVALTKIIKFADDTKF
jgi:hypothetical protein